MTAHTSDPRRTAQDRLAALFADRARVLVIHYACQSLDPDQRQGSPRVTAVALRNLASGDVTSFSIQAEAERQRLGPIQVLSRMDALERAMLDKLYDFLGANGGAHLVHWNMRDEVFGFPALALRHGVLGGTSLDIPEARRTDLARLLIDIYGRRYVPAPIFPSLARLNALPSRGMMTGKDEADAFERGQYAAVRTSTLVKVQLMAEVLRLAHERTLKTATPQPESHGPDAKPAGRVRRHIFISHASEDRGVAADVVRLLEGAGISCWIAPRNVPVGEDYQEAIVEAIEGMDGMVLLLSEAANESRHVKREVNLADEDGKPIFTLCLAGTRPKGALRYQLNNRQWADVGADLADAVNHLRQNLIFSALQPAA